MSSSALSKRLLPEDVGTPVAPWPRVLAAAAAVAATLPGFALLFVALAGLPPSQEGRLGGSSELLLRGLPATANRSGLLAATVMVPHVVDCYGYTGGTCLTEPCKPFRDATCVTGNCVCTSASGKCAGVDGICQSTVNKPVSKGFQLFSVRWPSQRLRMPGLTVFSQVSVSSLPDWLVGSEVKFDLYELPGRAGGKKLYFLSSVQWPNWVASVRTTAFTAASMWGLYALNLDHSIAPWDPQSVVVHICSLDKSGYPGSVMIGSPGLVGNPIWAYVHLGSWEVYGWQLSEDPGEGGYWTPDKPLEGVEDC